MEKIRNLKKKANDFWVENAETIKIGGMVIGFGAVVYLMAYARGNADGYSRGKDEMLDRLADAITSAHDKGTTQGLTDARRL